MANEKRLIYANALLEKMEHTSTDVCADYGDCFCEHGYSTPLFRLMVSETPTVDAVEVVHGEWEKQKGIYSCSICGKACPYDVQADIIRYWTCNYCPNCGAKMDGGNEDG